MADACELNRVYITRKFIFKNDIEYYIYFISMNVDSRKSINVNQLYIERRLVKGLQKTVSEC